MKLYNTLSGRQEDFTPLEPGKVGLYVCGPTVYDYTHIGHARTYLAFDLLVRFLEYQGLKVTYVQNITDVGHLVGDVESGIDKIARKAQETGQTPRQIVEHYTETHLNDLKRLNIRQPDEFPKASGHIPDIIAFITGLIDKGFAYVTEQQNVYFSVARDPDYGKLSHRGIAEIITGTRVEPAKDKRSPADFALWKAAAVSNSDLTWESPWGRGYPGWHIECSAMSRKYLGDTFDIHGSAVEHVFPHHENEIAQSESLTGQPMAHFWVHAGMLSINGQKMSKSLHNMITVEEALKEYSANEIRLAFNATHYRKPFDYTKAVMEQGRAIRKKVFMAYATNQEKMENKEAFAEIIVALENDLDTPQALQIWADKAHMLSQVQNDKLFQIFGLVYQPIEANKAAQKLVSEREAARSKGDFLTADNRKNELTQCGYEVIDSETRTIYIPR